MNWQIARQLGISVRTVEVHRFHLRRRLGVHNMAQLFRAALRLGLGPRRSARQGRGRHRAALA